MAPRAPARLNGCGIYGLLLTLTWVTADSSVGTRCESIQAPVVLAPPIPSMSRNAPGLGTFKEEDEDVHEEQDVVVECDPSLDTR